MKKLTIGILLFLFILSFNACSDKVPTTSEQLIPEQATITDIEQWCNDNGFEIVTNHNYPYRTEGNEYAIKVFNGSIKQISFDFTMWEDDCSGIYNDDILRGILIEYTFDDESAYKKGYDAITKEVELLNQTYKGIARARIETTDRSGSNLGKYHQAIFINMVSEELAVITGKYSDPFCYHPSQW